MGMDIYGLGPTGDRGHHFRNNVWKWHPLWRYCELVAPDLLGGNDGHSGTESEWGLDAAGAKELARILREEVSSGRMEIYERDYDPDMEDRSYVGVFDSLARILGVSEGPSFRFDVGNVVRFIGFLEDCGGFTFR